MTLPCLFARLQMLKEARKAASLDVSNYISIAIRCNVTAPTFAPDP